MEHLCVFEFEAMERETGKTVKRERTMEKCLTANLRWPLALFCNG